MKGRSAQEDYLIISNIYQRIREYVLYIDVDYGRRPSYETLTWVWDQTWRRHYEGEISLGTRERVSDRPGPEKPVIFDCWESLRRSSLNWVRNSTNPSWIKSKISNSKSRVWKFIFENNHWREAFKC